MSTVLSLNEQDVRGLIDMDECIEAMDDAFKQEAAGKAVNKTTVVLEMPGGGRGGGFRFKVGGLYGSNIFGLKAYGQPGAERSYLIYHYDIEHGLTGIVAAHYLTQVRTGAVSAVATKHLARPDAETVGIIGTGREARTQLDAVSRVRKLRQIRAFSRTPENREAFAADVSERLGVETVAVASAEECVRDVDIIVTATNTRDPVLFGAWLQPGVHINSIGATGTVRREIDEAVLQRSDRVVVELMENAQTDCGDLMYAAEHGFLDWATVHELGEVIAGSTPGRTSPADITLFDSTGTGTEDIAIASYLLHKAREKGIGREVGPLI